MPTDPFDLASPDAYRRWRDAKLAGYPTRAAELLVEVDDPRRLSDAEYAALMQRIRKTNMALYVSRAGADPDKALPRRLGERFGLHRLNANWLADEDGITSLTVSAAGERPGYIPYTNRAINWHTDGYYNRPEEQIRGLLLHCVAPAAEGGGNRLLDHEILYILLRDEDPELVRALMRPDAMTIPPGTDTDGSARAASVGPVFSLASDGSLHMRYTARRRNIEWHPDADVQAAAERVRRLLESELETIFGARLESGMGLICNNVLHDRSGFEDRPDAAPRLLYRARYFDRVVGS